MKITIEGEPKEIAALELVLKDDKDRKIVTDLLIDGKAVAKAICGKPQAYCGK